MSIFSWLKKRNHNTNIRHSMKALPTVNVKKSLPIDHSNDSPNSNSSIDERLQWFNHHLGNCTDLVTHIFNPNPSQTCALLYFRGMIDQSTIQEEVLKDILSLGKTNASDFKECLFDLKQLSVSDLKEITDMQKGLSAILGGHIVLLVDGDQRMIEFPFSSYETRAIQEAPNESVIRGPREAFIENLDINLTLIRRRMKTAAFKTEMMQIGKETQTNVVIAYVQGNCKPELLDEVKKRLSQIKIDGILGSGYLEEFIEDNPYSPFPQLQYTERPDVVTASILEGRVAIFMDGTPMVLIAPVTLFMLLQSAEDYYQRFIAATWIRWIRYIFLVVSLLLPSTYIAITTFHPEMIPSQLLISIASSREVIPFPALIEAFLMEIAFEALREAAVRIPKAIGQAVSIIGALIIGTAAVQAGVVSAFMVIIVSLTGIASFISPHFDLGLSFRILRFPIMILAGGFGLFGIACGLIVIYLHLLNLRSFGTPYLTPLAPLVFNELKDTLFRAPWWLMNKRPSLSGSNKSRQPKHYRNWTQTQEDEED
ncbi:spore germination protein GerKA [Paenibacillus pini JCM 16418]|uniref:Spore germination protein GerKA n=2 Tax=Paenibacillus TaxID=44249 RepID=W7YPK9_9BACL|nr:spore germination protein GerKA [Paenibacillus pini JCM 16418]